jgi:hypothetical protein
MGGILPKGPEVEEDLAFQKTRLGKLAASEPGNQVIIKTEFTPSPNAMRINSKSHFVPGINKVVWKVVDFESTNDNPLSFDECSIIEALKGTTDAVWCGFEKCEFPRFGWNDNSAFLQIRHCLTM